MTVCAIKSQQRMLGTFNQHLPIILSNNYWHQSKPTSLPDTGMGVILAV